MDYIFEVDNTNYTVSVEKDSGRVEILENDQLYWVGQWFPFQQYLSLPKFSNEDFRLKLQNYLKIKLSLEEISFPNL
jgi:hypothetical protein